MLSSFDSCDGLDDAEEEELLDEDIPDEDATLDEVTGGKDETLLLGRTLDTAEDDDGTSELAVVGCTLLLLEGTAELRLGEMLLGLAKTPIGP